jgi:hypothetical protein
MEALLGQVKFKTLQEPFGPPCKGETWAVKFARFQLAVTQKADGRRLPMFIDPNVAAMTRDLDLVPDQRLGVPLLEYPAGEILKYVCALAALDLRYTEFGIIISAHPRENR